MTFKRITISEHQMGGVPCIRALRIPVATVVGIVAEGMMDAEILNAYPDLRGNGRLAGVGFGWRRLRTHDLAVEQDRQIIPLHLGRLEVSSHCDRLCAVRRIVGPNDV